jgi:hypothetical protein
VFLQCFYRKPDRAASISEKWAMRIFRGLRFAGPADRRRSPRRAGLASWQDAHAHARANRAVPLRCDGIVNLTRSSRPSWPLSLERGQPYRRARDFYAPDLRATHGGRIPPLLNLTMPAGAIEAGRRITNLRAGEHQIIIRFRGIHCHLGPC